MTNSSFDCELCHQQHVYPKNGFPLCEPLVQILSVKAVELQKYNSCKLKSKELDEILSRIELFKNRPSDGISHIKDYCSDIRAQLQANTDSLILQIENLNHDMTQKINRFEIDSIQVYESKPENKFEYSIICKETEKSIRQFELTGNQFTDANQIIEILEKEKSKLNELVFKQNILRIESNETEIKLNENILGSIVYDMINMNV